MKVVSSCALAALVLCGAMPAAMAETTKDAPAKAEDFATCAAYYFNAVNVKPLKEYEAVYGAGERAFNEGVKRVGRKQVDDWMARASAEMTKLMASDWHKFGTVEQRYGADCAALMARVPAEAE